MTSNDKEIRLLKSDTNELIVKYQYIIEIIVGKFISSGSINISEKDEFIQLINERLLLSTDKIRKQYKGISLLRTYFSVIIKNICLEEINKRKRNTYVSLESINSDILINNTLSEDSYLNNEFDRLSKIFLMYNNKAPKLIFCLKSIYRLRLRITDFTKYCIKIPIDKIKKLIEIIDPKNIIPEYQLYEILTPYINRCDNQINKPDALRRWVKRKIDEIIELMNGTPKRANYDKETIQILLEKYYSKEKDKIMSKTRK